MPPVEPVGTYRAQLGEGPVWDTVNARLRWLDIPARRWLSTDPVTGITEVTDLDRQANAVLPMAGGGWVGAAGLSLCAVAASGAMSVLTELDPETWGRFNDAKCDAKGRLWVGTATSEPLAKGAFYRFSGRRGEVVIPGIAMSNGIGWSPDDRVMYCVDSTARCLYALDFDLETGAATHRRILLQLPEGQLPDGLAVDLTGNIWLAVWDGACVLHVSPAGEVLGRIELPTPRVTSCCFGGPAGADLFITTAAADSGAADDGIGGRLFVARPGVGGRNLVHFRP